MEAGDSTWGGAEVPPTVRDSERSPHSACGTDNGGKDDLEGLAIVLLTQLH